MFNTSRVVCDPTRASWRTPFRATSLARTCASNEVTCERDASSCRQKRITFSACARRALVEFVAALADQFLGLADLRPLAAVLVDRYRRLHAHTVGVVLVGRDLQVELLLDDADEIDLGQQVADGAVHAVAGGRDSYWALTARRPKSIASEIASSSLIGKPPIRGISPSLPGFCPIARWKAASAIRICASA